MSNITALIPIAPMPSHPDGEVLDETIASIRERLPTSEIILMFDGVNPTLAHLKPAYEIYTQNMLWRINHEMENVTPLVFPEHQHQSLMTRKALELVRTPLILWSEQDTPLHNDIPFKELSEVILTGYANTIRFHFEAQILSEHQHLMLDQVPIDILGQPFLRTRQWSGRPHLSSTKYYRHVFENYFDDQPRFIEHVLYGLIAEGGDNYDEHRLHIYSPSGTLVRSKHLDGRRKGATGYDPRPS